MKRHILTGGIIFLSLGLVSCEGWLGEESPMLNTVEDFFTSAETAGQSVIAAYVPLMWEYNNTYFSEFFIGDIASDDALKGGQNTADMAEAYDIDNFKTNAENTLLLQYYRAKFQGIQRANLAIEQISAMDTDETLTEELKARFIAEAEFLRAFYYFQLVRVFGGVPLVITPIYGSDDWIQARASVDDIYARITADLESAQADLPDKNGYAAEDLGRATSGAAQAMLLKAYLYWGNMKELSGDTGTADKYYEEARKWGSTFMTEQAGIYSLCPDYADNFTLEGENGPESVFEIQYMEEETSDYGEGNGFTRGTFATMLQRSRSTAFGEAGWGFNKPTQNLFDEYEVADDGTADPRRDATILTPDDDEIDSPEQEIYLGCPYLSIKRTLIGADRQYVALAHDSRSPINYPVIRYADVLLLYAEASLECDDANTAKSCLEQVRSRARGTQDILPEFPGYRIPDWKAGYAMHQLADTPEDLEMAIRHERRVELGMEGHRWFDLCRWGIVKDVMDAYVAQETDEAKAETATFVEGKHELFPIPQEEIDLGQILGQNPGY